MNAANGGIPSVEVAPDAAGVVLKVLAVTGDPGNIDADAVDARVSAAIESARAAPLDPTGVRAVRDMLKHGRYRATGRGKPAHEFLHKFAVEDRFPRVFGAVDLLNATSLRHALPMSLVDLDRAETMAFRLRRGRPEESYVFNSAGQSIDLRDLLLIATADADRPCANPVKDSMATKLTADSRRIAAFIYAPEAPKAEAALAELVEAYRQAWPGAAVQVG